MRTIATALAVLALLCPAAGLADEINQLGTDAVACATTATAADTSVPNTAVGRYYSVCNPSDATATVYVGDSDVTTSTGTPVAAGKCWSSGVRVAKNKTPYCIVASGTQSVRVMESP